MPLFSLESLKVAFPIIVPSAVTFEPLMLEPLKVAPFITPIVGRNVIPAPLKVKVLTEGYVLEIRPNRSAG